MIRPPRLRAGSRVALVAPAGPIADERVDAALERCRVLGLEPSVGAHARGRSGYLSGTDAERLADMEWAIESPEIDAIWALRGGYGAMRLLPTLDLRPLRRAPKPFLGFSDNTAIHLALARLGVISFHAPHAGGALPPVAERCLRAVLFEAEPPGPLPIDPLAPPPRTLAGGTVEGRLVGGNLALLAAGCGTGCALEAHGAILVLEEVGEPHYRVDRALTQLRLAGALDGVAGIAIGQFTGCDDEGGGAALDALLRERLGAADVPIVAGLPFGHVDVNWTLPLGARARLDADAGTLAVIEAAVS
jgi:muramoyltetrapeptide carboxypeptidase